MEESKVIYKGEIDIHKDYISRIDFYYKERHYIYDDNSYICINNDKHKATFVKIVGKGWAGSVYFSYNKDDKYLSLETTDNVKMNEVRLMINGEEKIIKIEEVGDING